MAALLFHDLDEQATVTASVCQGFQLLFRLLDAGFPFLKRALLTKSSNYIERDVVLERLARLGHPLDV